MEPGWRNRTAQGCRPQGGSRCKQRRGPLDPLSTELAVSFLGWSRGTNAEEGEKDRCYLEHF